MPNVIETCLTSTKQAEIEDVDGAGLDMIRSEHMFG
jgi:hypothetical protein